MSKSTASIDAISALTDAVILSNALEQQIERCQSRIAQAQRMRAITCPIFFDLSFKGILGERESIQAVPFDQLSGRLQAMLKTELLDILAMNADSLSRQASTRKADIDLQISNMRSADSASDQ